VDALGDAADTTTHADPDRGDRESEPHDQAHSLDEHRLGQEPTLMLDTPNLTPASPPQGGNCDAVDAPSPAPSTDRTLELGEPLGQGAAPALEPIEAPPLALPASSPGPARLARAHTLRFDAAGLSARGPRARNDDTWLVRSQLLLVADGVGGSPAGKAAADLAARTVRDTVSTTAAVPEQELIGAVEMAHHAILEQGRLNAARSGMACTLDAATLHPDGVIVGVHVGDSRVYYRGGGGEIVQLTVDEAIDGALLQSLGDMKHQVRPRLWQRTARLGDRVVLATDGLWSELEDRVVTALVSATAALTPVVAVQVLVDTALGAGASDNVTVVIADVVAVVPAEPC
jgi:serine/threonine protein phosphatase PrpC